MGIDRQKPVTEDLKREVTREEIKLQFHWYMFAFFITFLGSFLIPGIILVLYLRYFFEPYFLRTKSILALFTNIYTFLALIFMPLVIICCYLIHLLIVALITRWLWRITEKISSSKEGIIPRNINSKALNYYNIRSFMIKYPKNAFIKGPFPWLINWLYNFVGTNKIGKKSTIEEQFGADRFIEIGDNSYIGVNCGFSSHSVSGIFGNISYFKIKLGDNVTTSGLNCLAPGVSVGDNSYLLPLAGAVKHSMLKGNSYYFGAPLRKIFKKKISEYLKIDEEDLAKDKKLREKQEKIKLELSKI